MTAKKEPLSDHDLEEGINEELDNLIPALAKKGYTESRFVKDGLEYVKQRGAKNIDAPKLRRTFRDMVRQKKLIRIRRKDGREPIYLPVGNEQKFMGVLAADERLTARKAKGKS